jgi:hypothetical protein
MQSVRQVVSTPEGQKGLAQWPSLLGKLKKHSLRFRDEIKIRTNEAKDSKIISPASWTVRYFPAIRRRSSGPLGTTVSCYNTGQMSDSAN